MPMPPFVSVAEAAHLVRAGGIIIYPTETFWAIGCSALLAGPVEAICAIKGRKPDKPLPLIAASASQAAAWADLAFAPSGLIQKFWPGPLSLLLRGKNSLASKAINPQHKTALRISASKTARAISCQAAAPLIATSANMSGDPPARDLAGLAEQLRAGCETSGLPWGIVAEIPEKRWNAPSTLLEPLRQGGVWRLKILREGAIRRADLLSSQWELI